MTRDARLNEWRKLHKMGRLMFWVDYERPALIERALMDGTTREEVINSNLGEPYGLTIDYTANRIYWTDNQLDRVESASLTGSDRQQLEVASIASPFGIAVDSCEWTYISEIII
ncbi:low-density lipoprotein receptor-related protein 4-like [Anneissia japonica]|uniref:low-density lipoprotein receptor-related protein 4-like n=1 Tax=Anneissia japonica TaxID=1529436 RepID=UPI001425910D|nr:low-density lipoprotein receptor-related protein 4-like [Anneissia japonica]